MKIIENRGGADSRAVAEAAKALRDGKIIIYPTDTLYALGCDALNLRAIEKLCKIKGINPDKNLLSVVCSDISQAAEYARIDNRAFTLLRRYLPGAFTFILPAATSLPKVFKGRKSVGIRIPDNEFATALAAELGNPILSSSVTSGEDEDSLAESIEPSSLAMEYSAFRDIEITIDNGEGGTIPSTIIDCMDSTAPEIIREGKGVFEF